MKKQVPEGNSMSIELQLQILKEKLTGNRAFATCRGKLDDTFFKQIGAFLEETDNPTQFLKSWDRYASSIRIMTHLLSQFKRDGLDIAYHELSSALRDPEFVLRNEEMVSERSKPVTALMLDPERTLQMIHWLIAFGPSELETYLLWKSGNPARPAEATIDLFEKFSQLETYSGRAISKKIVPGIGIGLALRSAWQELFPKTVFSFLDEGVGLTFGRSRADCQFYIRSDAFIYLFEAEQSEVLSQFPRHLQFQIATWQFRIPKTATLEKAALYLYPETADKDMKKAYPALCSKGFARIFGGLIIPGSRREIEEKNMLAFTNRNK